MGLDVPNVLLIKFLQENIATKIHHSKHCFKERKKNCWVGNMGAYGLGQLEPDLGPTHFGQGLDV